MNSWIAERWTTTDEINFLQQLHKKPAAFQKYANLVLEGRRVYDKGVSIGCIRAAIRDLSAPVPVQ